MYCRYCTQSAAQWQQIALAFDAHRQPSLRDSLFEAMLFSGVPPTLNQDEYICPGPNDLDRFVQCCRAQMTAGKRVIYHRARS